MMANATAAPSRTQSNFYEMLPSRGRERQDRGGILERLGVVRSGSRFPCVISPYLVHACMYLFTGKGT